MADEAAEHHCGFWPDGSREPHEQRSPIDQELGSDERLSRFGIYALGGKPEQA